MGFDGGGGHIYPGRGPETPFDELPVGQDLAFQFPVVVIRIDVVVTEHNRLGKSAEVDTRQGRGWLRVGPGFGQSAE